MQQAQQNFKRLAIGFFSMVLAAGPSMAAPIAHPSGPDLLSDGKPGPCDPKLDQPGYKGGVDVAGNPVAPADLPAVRTSAPSEILVPLGGKRRWDVGPVAALDGQAVEPLLNPSPDCKAKPH